MARITRISSLTLWPLPWAGTPVLGCDSPLENDDALADLLYYLRWFGEAADFGDVRLFYGVKSESRLFQGWQRLGQSLLRRSLKWVIKHSFYRLEIVFMIYNSMNINICIPNENFSKIFYNFLKQYVS